MVTFFVLVMRIIASHTLKAYAENVPMHRSNYGRGSKKLKMGNGIVLMN